MQPRTPADGHFNAEILMNVASTLADLTGSLDLCQQIPAYLSRTLALEPTSLAVVRQSPVSGPSLFLFCTSAAAAAGDTSLRQNLLNVYDKTRPPTLAEGPAFRAGFDPQQGGDSAPLAELPRTTVFSHKIDDEHRMMLVVHQRHDSPTLAAETMEQLELIARQLAKLLSCLVAWHTRPATLGAAFQKITAREWAVIRGLATDLGEKQLADQLQVSPHTLHSHVKSVYRRLGVQGRLSVNKRVEQALRAQRMSRVNEGAAVQAPAVARPVAAAVAG